EEGFQLDGFMTQANFVKISNIAEVFSNISQRLSTKQLLKYSNDIKDLLLNDKISEVFKVIAFSLDFDFILVLFDNQDNI
ncbi:SAM-dependent methyltransferase, partial [Francisella tularensis subsp. holarctica]|nr:SAM-dependent methyltransferase [Francisella tularensis subsp. holarctica]